MTTKQIQAFHTQFQVQVHIQSQDLSSNLVVVLNCASRRTLKRTCAFKCRRVDRTNVFVKARSSAYPRYRPRNADFGNSRSTSPNKIATLRKTRVSTYGNVDLFVEIVVRPPPKDPPSRDHVREARGPRVWSASCRTHRTVQFTRRFTT